jgi:hypothetical protein
MELTARQASIKAKVEKYNPTFEIEVEEVDEILYLRVKNPNRPYAGTVTLGGWKSKYTNRENHVASYSGPGTLYRSIRIGDVFWQIRSLAD